MKRDSDGRELVARSADSHSPGDAGVEHLDAELRASLPEDRRAILRPAERVDGHRQSWLLYDAIAGQPLDTTKACDLEEFWEIAEAATRALADGHRSGRAHGRLESNCVWWDPKGRRAALLGMVTVDQSHLANQLPPTLDTAPELILAERAKVSAAADIYSLGAIFYRLLSGQPAVSSTGNLAFDAAANPPPRLDPERIPEPLSNLVTRMLSKAPTSRPPNATAVLAELQAVRSGSKPPPPNLEQGTAALVGRAFELERMLERMRFVENGAASVVRVAGEPGIGKSTLLGEFARRVSSKTRIVADAKFEQFQRGRPFGALLTACGNALSHVLAGDELVLTTTKQRLRDADPSLLAVLRADISELEHLCGKLPDVPEAGPTENEKRFKRAFGELLSTLCSEETPLVLVLDDLQWVDRETADLLTEVHKAGLPDHLLLVLAYRETEAKQNAVLVPLFDELKQAPVIALGPFDPVETGTFCRLLVPDCEAGAPLASVLHQRSQGNPLHCVELLKNFVANGELTQERGRWQYRESGIGLPDLSDTVATLIRERLSREPAPTRRLLAAAACIGHEFSEEVLAIALATEPTTLRQRLRAAVEHGFLVASSRGDKYAFCHDRIQQISIELSDEAGHQAACLRLGRYYRERLTVDRDAIFPCLDYLNQVRTTLEDEERHALSLLNLEGAKRARATIAYKRAIPLLRLYLESERISPDARFEATLLLAECLCLLAASEARAQSDDERAAGVSVPSETESFAQRALEECSALAITEDQTLKLLYSRLLFCVHNQAYTSGVEVALDALQRLGHPLPHRPWPPRVLAKVLMLSARMRRLNPDELARQPDRTTEHDLRVFRFLVGLWGPSHWTNPWLNLLVCLHLIELTLRCGNGKHSSMAYISYAIILHMQRQPALAVRYARVAEVLAQNHSPYTRAVVRFLRHTFFGVLERPLHEVLQKYDEALKECVAHGEIIASHVIDGAVTTLPHLGPELPLVQETLQRYEREARAGGAETSREMIGLVHCWRQLLLDGADDPETGKRRQNALHRAVKHKSFAAGRDLLRMQIEYLAGRDEEVLGLGRGVQGDMLLKGNPLHTASHALFVILASTRSRGKLTLAARKGMRYLGWIDAVALDDAPSPGTFRPSLRLAEGVRAEVAGDPCAVDLLREAAELAKQKGQGLVRAISLERLARLHGARGENALCVERIRDAAQAFRRFGAFAKADALVREFPALDWTHVRPRPASDVGIQIEGIMRAATAILEATSTDELGPTLLRVIATTAGAMRAFLFAVSEGKLLLVAGCERDRPNLLVTPTPLDELDPRNLAIKPIHRVERSHEVVELPRDRAKFLDDPYLTGSTALRALLCVPLLYRGELVAILYLENSSNADTFSQEEATLVTLLGKQAAIAMTNADNHRLEVEALQAKVNPHFLYNALTAIAALVDKAPEQAEEAVYKLNRLYRYMVSSRAELRVPLEKELAIVRDYLALEQVRFGSRVNVKWEIDTATETLQVPALLLQPLAENAVKHGVARKMEGGTVTIGARVENDTLLLTVGDDGPGWYEGVGGTKFGLKSVRRRLELLYGNRAELRIVKKNGVTLELRIPI